MSNLPVGNPLSGPAGPPFLGASGPVSAGTVSIYSTEITGPSGDKTIGPLHIALTQTSADEAIDLTFTTAGPQSFTSPAGATLMVIVPPGGNTVALLLGNVPISPGLPCLVSLPSTAGGQSYTITSAAAVTGVVEISFA